MIGLLLALTTLPGVDVAVLNPRCVTESNGSLNTIAALIPSGRLEVTSSGFTPLTRPGLFVIPEVLADAEGTAEAVRKMATSYELVDPDLPVLVSPYEVTFQWPKSTFDWLQKMERSSTETATRDVRRESARLGRIRVGGSAALVLQLTGSATVSTDPLSYRRSFALQSRLVAKDDTATFISVTRPLGDGARVASEVASWRAEHPSGLLIHAGDAVSPWNKEEERELCASELRRWNPDAIVPRALDLALGMGGLLDVSKRHNLPYLAANLEDAEAPAGSEHVRPFPRFRLFRSKDSGVELVTAVIGIVDPESSEALTPAQRQRVRIRDVGIALSETKQAILEQLGRHPDLTIVAVGAESAKVLGEVDRAHVDLVVGDFIKYDAVTVHERVEVSAGARERARHPHALARIRGGDFGLSLVHAAFESTQGGTVLTAIDHDLRPILDDGPIDVAMFRRIREVEERTLAESSKIALPDVAPLVERSPDLLPLVFGERVPYFGRFRKNDRSSPIRLTDPLWMRIVTSAVMDELSVDVALARCPHRQSDMIGPVSNEFVDTWSRSAATLEVMQVSGAALAAVSEVVAGTRALENESPTSWIYAGGLDFQTMRVRGRPLDPRARYRVALTDDVANLPEVARALREGAAEAKFQRTEDGWEPDAAGQELTLREVIERKIARWKSGEGSFDSAQVPSLERALSDRSAELKARWQFRIDDLSLSGSKYEASESSSDYAATQETRLTTPDNLALAMKGDVAITYDDSGVALEVRTQAVLDRVLVEIPGVEVPAQEQADDLVTFAELRLLAVSIGTGGSGVPITPFVRATFDTELTPTPNPAGGDFSRQQIVRGALGLVARPGRVLREIRAGGLFQADATAGARKDFGLTFGYALSFPIIDRVALESRLDGRWLARDADDQAGDLALYIQTPNRLRVELGRDFSAFLMADLVLGLGKIDPARDAATSLIVGGGLSFSRVFEL